MQNYNLKSKILAFLILFFTFNFLIFNFTWAHDPNSANPFWMPGQGLPLVPCGGYLGTCQANYTCSNSDERCLTSADCGKQPDCSSCELLHLAKHLIDFGMIVATPILATLFFVYAGILIMVGGASPGMLSQGRRIFKDTMIGLLIVMLAWLGTNTLLKTLANYGIIGEKVKQKNLQWYQFTCTESGIGIPPSPGTVVISDVEVRNINSDGATIYWVTNIPSSSIVNYGLTSSYGLTSTNNVSNPVTEHLTVLSNLSPGTTYNFMVSSVAETYPANSGNYTFTTNSTSPCQGTPGRYGVIANCASTYLRINMLDNLNVKLLQKDLYSLGYITLPLDDDFGPKTKTAVETFQSDYGLSSIDGVVGGETQTALEQAMGIEPPPPPSSCVPLTSGPGAYIDNFDIQPRRISASSMNVNVTLRVRASFNLLLNTCASKDFYWRVMEVNPAGNRTVIRSCDTDARGCPTLTQNDQCFNFDFATTLPSLAGPPPITRNFYALIKCIDSSGSDVTESAPKIEIIDNQ